MIESESSLNMPIVTRRALWLRRSGLAVLALLLCASIAVSACLLWLRSAARTALPTLDGEVRLAGLSAPVTVRRDGRGVPHIEADSQDDLWMAQGYVTAQDRLWQMDALRRGSNGELAEILGPSLVKRDLPQRVLGLRRVAERLYASMPAGERQRLNAYAQGVNLFLEQHRDSLPPEFRLLHYRPRPWTGADSISVGLIMVQRLDTHWPAKLARERVEAALKHNPKLIADLYPVGSWRDRPPTGVKVDMTQPRPAPEPGDEEDEEDEPTEARALPPALDLHDLEQNLDLPTCAGCTSGSNNWVVAGAHTASGKPLLANDMHLALSAPGIWYTADLSAPGYHAAGVSLPGFPFILAGRNEHVAWGFTALMADVQDLYVEKLDGKGHYEDETGQWKPLETVRETIKVRGGKDVSVEVASTGHGPILTPMLKSESRAIALKWTLYDPALGMPSIYLINTASSAAEFAARLEGWSYPTQNVLFADDQGHIGYHAIGKIPVPFPDREKPHAHGKPEGRTGAVDNADPRLVPGKFIPFDLLPNAFDPPSGFLATANSRVTPGKAPVELTLEWHSPYRAERIYKALEGRDGLTAAEMLAVQSDVYSEVNQQFAHRFAYAIDHAQKTGARLQQAADLMRVWDGRLTADSAAASVVTRTREALWQMLLESKLGKETENYRWAESDFAAEEIVMHARPEWLPQGYKSWDELMTEAVRRGMKTGKAPGDVRQWTYGSWHVLEIEHPLAAILPLAGRLAGSGAQPLAGDISTVKQAWRSFGPSQRFVMDWSNPAGAIEVLPMGESGNPASPNFADQWPEYAQGKEVALPFSPASVQPATRHTLRLIP